MRPAVTSALLLLILPGCSEGPLLPVAEVEKQEIKAAIAGRPFDPSRDANLREGVIIDFFSDVGL